jgi:hypothetical protein
MKVSTAGEHRKHQVVPRRGQSSPTDRNTVSTREIAMADYLADVKKYDATADESVVNKIVKHLGIALRNRDSSLVSCTDPKELGRVRDNWAAKKLGVTDGAKADSAIEKVCQTMSADSSKSRVTFYYLVAKQLGKLGDL